MAGKGKSGLSDIQERFVAEYLKDLNAAAAYQRAGYKATGNAAEVNASRLLRNAKVKEAIAAKQAKIINRLEVKAADVLAEYARVAFSDIGQILDFSGTDPRLRPVNEIPEDARRVLSSMKVKRSFEGTGEDAREVEVTEFKLWDKLNALEKLARHLGLLKDAAQVNIGPIFKLYAGFSPDEV